MNMRSALAEGLFATRYDPSDNLQPAVARRRAVHELKVRGVAGCVCCVAAEYGDHPEIAAARMAWALALVGAE
jgi:hypothetical protein